MSSWLFDAPPGNSRKRLPPGTVTVRSEEGFIASLPVKWERFGNLLKNTDSIEATAISSRKTIMDCVVTRTDGTELHMVLKNPIRAEPGAFIKFKPLALQIELHDHLYAFPGTELEDEEDDDDWDDDDDDNEPEEAPLAAAQADVVDRLQSLSIDVQVKQDLKPGQWLVDPQTWGALYGAWSKRHASKREQYDDDDNEPEEAPLAAAPIDEASWAPIAAIYQETARRSGRTTRLLAEAVRRAIEGKAVHFVVSNRMQQADTFKLLGERYSPGVRLSCGFEAHMPEGPGFVRVIVVPDYEKLDLALRRNAIWDHQAVEQYGVPFIPKPRVGSDYRFPVVAGIEHGQTGNSWDSFPIKISTSPLIPRGKAMLLPSGELIGSPTDNPRAAHEQKMRELAESQAKLAKKLRTLDELKESGDYVTPEAIAAIMGPSVPARVREHMKDHIEAFKAVSGSNSVTRGEAPKPQPGLTLAELHQLDVERALSAMKS